jgi:Domain of Unknown Function (DUF1521)
MSSITPNANILQSLGLDPSLLKGMAPEVAGLIESSVNLALAAGDFAAKFSSLMEKYGLASTLGLPAPVAEPAMADSCHPAGSLRTEGNDVLTAGGYRIEMLGQYEWKITGPDGRSTRVWGDPHVAEGDGGTWDFKRDSTFVLGDGTRINVTTVPAGNGATVTGSLEIISGNDRVVVSDIDKGTGRAGTVTQDGYQHVNSFGGNDVFAMGRETDDWSFTGREIIGSHGNGESFKLGDPLSPLSSRLGRLGGGDRWASFVFNGLMRRWLPTWRPSERQYNAYEDRNGARWEGRSIYDHPRHVKQMRRSLRAMGEMFLALSEIMKLTEQFSARRTGARFSA